MVLSTGRTLYHYNAATQTRRSTGLTTKQPEAYVEIHPKTARKLGVEDGQMVDVATRRGRVRARAMHSRQVRRNVIWMPFHFPDVRTNNLTNDAGDEVTGTGEYKVCAARIEPLAGQYSERDFPGAYASAVHAGGREEADEEVAEE
ncbi:MAG: molybdopterin dinucleotide binding domain-containing protein [Acidobacteriota bacterium]